MKRWEALEIFGRLRSETIVVYGPGGLSAELEAKSPSDLNIYSPMPYPTPFVVILRREINSQRGVRL